MQFSILILDGSGQLLKLPAEVSKIMNTKDIMSFPSERGASKA
jgi:hypothetical protein